MSMLTFSVLVWATAVVDASSATPPRFDVVWNGPSAGCGPKLTDGLTKFGLTVNKDMAFSGANISLFYKIGVWPTLKADYNATPCWVRHSNCSWTPWGDITPTSNGGVPQMANMSLHLAQVKVDVMTQIPDPSFSGILIIDWEAWRVVTSMNDDSLSSYREYSQRLVRAEHPDWNQTQVALEATSRFDTAGTAFFIETAKAVRALLPRARIGYYEYPMPDGAANDNLADLWDALDVLCPSIYPHSTNATAEAGFVVKAVAEAQRLQANVMARRRVATDNTAIDPDVVVPRSPLAVLPYARALVDDGSAFTRPILATQIQIPAGMGAEGVILWGASSDYHNNGCAMVEAELTTPAGPVISQCKLNQQQCANTRCSSHGRCVDVDMAQITTMCLTPTAHGTCRCDAGFSGSNCATADNFEVV